MKLFYNPAFSNGAYVDFSDSPILFDAKVVNTAGLCKVLRLHAGLSSDVQDYGKRFVGYLDDAGIVTLCYHKVVEHFFRRPQWQNVE